MLLCIGEFGEGRPDFGDGGQPGRQLVKKKKKREKRKRKKREGCGARRDRHPPRPGPASEVVSMLGPPARPAGPGWEAVTPSPATHAILLQLKAGDLVHRV